MCIRDRQYSGYGIEDRIKIYKSAKRRYDETLKKDSEGVKPLYRSKDWNRSERLKTKEFKKKTWFKNDGSDAVFFVKATPGSTFFVKATPGSTFAEKCKAEFKKTGLKIIVVERSGRSVKKNLVKSNPFKKRGCNREDCAVCRLDGDVDCKDRGVHYKISCAEAEDKGEQCNGCQL